VIVNISLTSLAIQFGKVRKCAIKKKTILKNKKLNFKIMYKIPGGSKSKWALVV